MLFYTIYKITNTLNGKFYIGKHQTKNLDDGYMGSGNLVKRAIAKHGLENFTKEILFVFDSEQEMNDKEKELVVLSEQSYNLCEGGKGGFGYINRNGLKYPQSKLNEARLNKIKSDPDFYRRMLDNRKKASEKSCAVRKTYTREKRQQKFTTRSFLGKQHSAETKAKISATKKRNYELKMKEIK